MTLSRDRSIPILVLLYLLMFWSDVATYRPGMDSMVYGTLAKNVLATGDWATLHYTGQAYSNFYQHPPLAIWMMAISMKIAGFFFGDAAAKSDVVLKVLPSLVSATTVTAIYFWAKRIRGKGFAVLATVILLTSVRFAKYSKGFMLDPFLAAFSIWAVYLAIIVRKNDRYRFDTALLSGIFVSAAFMSKGPFAFAPLGVILLFYALSIRAKEMTRVIPAFFVGCALPIGLWFLFGGGEHYLERYYVEHVATRIGHYTFGEHLEPLRNLIHVYWPWLPFAAVGFAVAFREFFASSRRDRSAAALTAFAFISGFTAAASFLEQYQTATYPCLAIVTALGVPRAWSRYRDVAEKAVLVLLVAFLIFLPLNPHALRGTEYKNPFRIALQEARSRCRDPGIHRVVVSTGIAEIWYALSMGAWNTDWDARSDAPDRTPEETGGQILLAGANDPVAKNWIPTDIEADGLRIYRSREVSGCDTRLVNASRRHSPQG